MTKILAVAATMLLGTAAVAQAQTQASADANVSVTVYRALQLSSTGSIDLGIVNPGATVSLGADVSPVEFEAEGEPGAGVAVTAPSTITLNRSGGGGSFSLNMALTADASQANQGSAGAVPGSVTLSGTGFYYFWLGVANTTIDVAQATGVYEGTYTLTVEYN